MGELSPKSSAAPSLASGRLADGLHGLRSDDIDTELAKLRGSAAWIAVDALRDARLAGRSQPVGPHQIGCECQGQCGVGQAGVRSDFLIAVAAALEHLNVRRLRRAVILFDRVHTRVLPLPF